MVVTAAEARAPQADSFRVNFGKGLEETDGVANIINLLEWDQPPFGPVATAEAPVIEGESHKAGAHKNLGIIGENDRTNTGEAVAQDDAGAALAGLEAIRQKEVALHPDAFAKKIDDAFFHCETPR